LHAGRLASLCSRTTKTLTPDGTLNVKSEIMSILDQLPLHQITHLQLGPCTDATASIIAMLPNLKHLTINFTIATANRINTLTRAPNFMNKKELEHLKIVLKGPDSTVIFGE
jgi:hypothetical protein